MEFSVLITNGGRLLATGTLLLIVKLTTASFVIISRILVLT